MEKLILKAGANGTGVFTILPIQKGEKILNFEGELIPRSPRTENLLIPEDDRYIQVGIDLFIGPSGKIDDHINHSCNPNTGVMIINNTAKLLAIKNIQPDEELTYDYSIQMYNEPWSMECHCGSSNCRKIIREYRFLTKEIKDYYLKLKLVPKYNQAL